MPGEDRLYQMLERVDTKVDTLYIEVVEIKTTQKHQQEEINDIKAVLSPDGRKLHTLWFVGGAIILGGIAWVFRMLPTK